MAFMKSDVIGYGSICSQLCSVFICPKFFKANVLYAALILCVKLGIPHMPSHKQQPLSQTHTHTKRYTRAYKLYFCSNEQPLHCKCNFHKMLARGMRDAWLHWGMPRPLLLAPAFFPWFPAEIAEHLMRFKLYYLVKLPTWAHKFLAYAIWYDWCVCVAVERGWHQQGSGGL